MTYNSCQILPLKIFVDCLIDGEYSKLSDDELINKSDLWQQLYQEYIGLLETPDTKAFNALFREVLLYRSQIVVIENAVYILRKSPYPELIELLQENDFCFDFNSEDPEQYYKDLDRVLVQLKSIQFQLNEATRELDGILAKGGEEMTRSSFDMQIMSLSKFLGFQINDNEMTTARYAAAQNLYYKHNEAVNNAERQNR